LEVAAREPESDVEMDAGGGAAARQVDDRAQTGNEADRSDGDEGVPLDNLDLSQLGDLLDADNDAETEDENQDVGALRQRAGSGSGGNESDSLETGDAAVHAAKPALVTLSRMLGGSATPRLVVRRGSNGSASGGHGHGDDGTGAVGVNMQMLTSPPQPRRRVSRVYVPTPPPPPHGARHAQAGAFQPPNEAAAPARLGAGGPRAVAAPGAACGGAGIDDIFEFDM
jgi:hypothetical protein